MPLFVPALCFSWNVMVFDIDDDFFFFRNHRSERFRLDDDAIYPSLPPEHIAFPTIYCRLVRYSIDPGER